MNLVFSKLASLPPKSWTFSVTPEVNVKLHGRWRWELVELMDEPSYLSWGAALVLFLCFLFFQWWFQLCFVSALLLSHFILLLLLPLIHLLLVCTFLYYFYTFCSLTFSSSNRLTPSSKLAPPPLHDVLFYPTFTPLISPPAPDLASPGPLPSPSVHLCSFSLFLLFCFSLSSIHFSLSQSQVGA